MKTEELENKIITFDSIKQFKFVKRLGHGGTGDTNLFLDEAMDILFAIKKYSPSAENNIEECYKRFLDEIKILFTLFNENVVRIYNYYLYPHLNTGYIQMEYIEGKTIDKVNPVDYNKTWNDYFIDVINAFVYLHENNILHRDIRPQNFMINSSGTLKIIDFGFGKRVINAQDGNSVILNWPASIPPEEVEKDKDYTYSTEIYYLGELFKNLTNDDSTFLYKSIINKMLEYSPRVRYKSCLEIKEDISNNFLTEIDFSDYDREVYQNFADELMRTISKFSSEPRFITNIDKIRKSMENEVRVSSLESHVQNNDSIISIFVNSGYSYWPYKYIQSKSLLEFYRLFIQSSYSRQEIIVNSIIGRLKQVKVEINESDFISDDDLPF